MKKTILITLAVGLVSLAGLVGLYYYYALNSPATLFSRGWSCPPGTTKVTQSGIGYAEFCVFKMTDAGKPCHSASECQAGVCALDVSDYEEKYGAKMQNIFSNPMWDELSSKGCAKSESGLTCPAKANLSGKCPLIKPLNTDTYWLLNGENVSFHAGDIG